MAKNESSKVLSKKEKRLDEPRNQTGVVTPGKKPAVPKQDAQMKSRSRRTRMEAVIINPVKELHGNPKSNQRECEARGDQDRG